MNIHNSGTCCACGKSDARSSFRGAMWHKRCLPPEEVRARNRTNKRRYEASVKTRPASASTRTCLAPGAPWPYREGVRA